MVNLGGRKRGLGGRGVAAALVFLLFLPAVASAVSVPLTLRNRTSTPRTNEPVTFGVPLPMGAVPNDQSVSISGRDAQFRAIGTWPDGSVRWLLCDFDATVPANGSVTYQLDNGAGNVSGTPLSTVDTGAGITVVTGPMKFTVKRGNFNLLDEVWLDENADGTFAATERVVLPGTSPGFTLMDRNGVDYATSADGATTIEVESSGPLRTVLKATGHLVQVGGSAKHMEFTCRIYAYAGKPFVRVFFSEMNDRPTGTWANGAQPLCRWLEGQGPVGGSLNSTFHEDLSLVIPINVTGSKSYFMKGDASEAPFGGPLTGTANLYQDSSGEQWWASTRNTTFKGYKIYENGSQVASGDNAEGWVDLSDSRWGLSAGMRFFWQNFPAGLEVNDTGVVRVHLYDERFAIPCEHRSGEQKTREILLNFHQGTAASAGVETRMAGLAYPLRADVPSQWAMDTQVLEKGVPYDPTDFYDYENNNGDVMTDGLLGARRDADFYGWQDFGEFWSDFEGGGSPPQTNRAAYNNEYDNSYGCLMQYARLATARPGTADKFWDLAEQNARHQTDIDIYHVWSGPFQWLWGGQWIHTGHGSSGYDDPHRGNNPMPDHYMSQGLINYWYYTGYEFAHDAAAGLGENMYWRVMNGPGMPGITNAYQERNCGHAMQILIEAYYDTWDPKYVTGIEKLLVDGNISNKWFRGGALNGDATDKFKPWMTSLQVKSMGRFIEVYQLVTGTIHQDTIQQMIEYCHAMVDLTFHPATPELPAWMPYQINGDGSLLGSVPNHTSWHVRTSDAFMFTSRYASDPAEKALFYNVAKQLYESGSYRHWCTNCAPYQFGKTKTHAVLATSGHQYMWEVMHNAPPDDVPPATISNLGAVLGSTAGSAVLTWTAPGDDGTSGSAASYQVRRAGTAIVSGSDWLAATVVSGAPVPQPAGASETMTVTALPDGTHFFAVRAYDDALNLGGISNSPSVTISGTGDSTPPAMIDDLAAVTGTGAGQVDLSWTAPGDDGDVGRATIYRVRRAAGAITSESLWNAAATVSGVPVPQTAGSGERMTVSGLGSSATWYFSVRAEDEVGNLAPLSNSPSGVSAGDTTPPAISNVAVAETSAGTLTFTWNTNEAATSIVLWDDSYGGSGPPANTLQDGLFTTTHSIELSGLTGGSTVHYQIQGRDEAGNLGSTSVASVVVNQSDVLPPIISLLGATSDGSGTGIVVVWQTNEPADSRVEYGPTNAYGSSTTLDPTLITSHVVSIGGLTQGQTIHYRARTRDASGNESMSVDRTFTLNTDTTAPVITLLPITYTSSQARISLELSEPGFGTIQWGIMSPTEQLQFLGSVDAASTMYEATLPNLLYSVTYQYVIQITDPSGNLASASGSFLFLGVDGGDTVPPSTPFGVSVADFVPSAGVTLSWAQNSEADLAGYRVYRRIVSGDAATETWTALSGSAALNAASFTDPTVADDTSYEYTVTAIDQSSNESAPSNAVLFDPSLWGTVTLLSPSSPNPFSLASGTRISFRAPGGSAGERFTTALKVFDVTGRRIRTLFKGELSPGEARVASWDGRDLEGREVAAGVYFSMLEVEGAAPTVAKMTLLR